MLVLLVLMCATVTLGMVQVGEAGATPLNNNHQPEGTLFYV